MRANVLILIVCSVFLQQSEERDIRAAKPSHFLPLLILDKEQRIIGGNEVAAGYAPYQVSIQNTFGEHVCGGSIVNSQWILTAAHCLEWPKDYLKVVTGTVNWTSPRAEYAVAEAKVHCLYNQPMYHNDIALLRLNTSIVFDAFTKPVELAWSNTLDDDDSLELTGWGTTKLWGRTPDLLQKIDLKYLSHEKCAAAIRNSAWLGAGHICTFTKSGEGSCHGDSGSPLVDANKVQVGLVNWGEACAIGYPDVYASVPYYHNWIRSTIADLNTC